VNDAGILEAAVAAVADRGWSVSRCVEADVEAGRVPEGDLYLNMCQGRLASERLLTVPMTGPILNHPNAVLNCHRHRMVPLLEGGTVPFPLTCLMPTQAGHGGSGMPPWSGDASEALWVKRGDVHAERNEDVVATDRSALAGVLRTFAARGISQVAVQRHVPGPVIKFYGLADGRFFRWYPAGPPTEAPIPADEVRLRDVAFDAARTLGLEVFGGDVVLSEPDWPVLIDINDWPSFARFRQDAGRAIADYAMDRAVGVRAWRAA
jgi:hypothetical protein